METEFTSTFTRGGNILTPERIIITEDSITWRKRNNFLIGSDSKTIPISRVATIDINQHLVGCDITITSVGDDKIIAKNFTKSAAMQIKELIEGNM